jgi:peptidoglycan/xylan/chitin deacetylase (PgdA/CDA1 family)
MEERKEREMAAGSEGGRASKKATALLARAAVLLGIVGLAAILLAPPSAPSPGNRLPAYQPQEAALGVILTFEIAEGERVPLEVLEVLKRFSVPATFLVTGSWAQGHPALVRRMLREGHRVGSLGWRQVSLDRYPREVMREEMARAARLLSALGVGSPLLFRPPNGTWNATLLEEAERLGQRVILWGLDSHDWSGLGPDYVAERVTRRAEPGQIIRFTADDSSADTPLALPAVLVGLKERGLEVMSIR